MATTVVLMLGMALTLATAGADAQDGAAGAQPLGPGAEHRKLDTLVGKWDVAVVYRLGGQEHHGTATCETQWVLDGRYLRQEYQSHIGNQPFTVLQYVGYDTRRKRFFEIKFDNMETGVLHTEGDISADGKTITNSGEVLDAMTGKPGKLRTVTTFLDPDHYTLEWFITGADGKEEKTVSMKHTRRK